MERIEALILEVGGLTDRLLDHEHEMSMYIS